MKAEPVITGFTTIWGVTVNPMVAVLAIGILAVIWLLYRANRDAEDPFDVMDLVMDGGRASPTKLAFLAAFVMTTWVIVDREIKASLTADFFWAYLLAWVAPLTAKVIFNKTDAPALTVPKEGP